MKTTWCRWLVVAAALAGAAASCELFEGSRLHAEAEARSYVRTMFPGARSARVVCMDFDTDGDGYVSCDVALDGRPVALECAVRFASNSGCKLRGAVLTTGAGQ